LLTNRDILICGAGSTGLSAALFLLELGYKPRIIDKRKEPAKITKALGVNSRTLELLENSGVTNEFLKNGRKVSAFNFWCNGKHLYRNDLSSVRHPYPFMLVQPQHETESILEAAINKRGIFVERGINLMGISPKINGCLLSFENGPQKEFTGILIAADGSKSTIRESLGIKFKGWEHNEAFKLYDIELTTDMNHDEGHYLFYPDGAMLMLQIRNGIWRIGGSVPNAFERLPEGTKTGKITWEPTFTVREMVAERFSVGNVFLLGDAAHVHSPAGAKGMNLCIEDSYIFANLFHEGRQNEFHKVRHAVISRNVGIIGQLTDKVAGNNVIGKTARRLMPYFSFLFPVIMPRMRKFLLGIK
jgi:2-polyprenyl-6-methoxyphenol hydroxylase-like FAD-dependent oxidoreductase